MQRIIISIIFSATAIAVFFMWTSPILKEIQNLNNQSAELNDVLSRAKEIKSVKEELLSRHNSITQDDIDRLNKLLPSKVESIRLIIDVSDIVARHGLLLSDIKAESSGEEGVQSSFKDAPKLFQTAPISFSVAGSYESFISFLGDLEKSLQLIEIKGLDFSASEDNLYEFNINAITFWKK